MRGAFYSAFIPLTLQISLDWGLTKSSKKRYDSFSCSLFTAPDHAEKHATATLYFQFVAIRDQLYSANGIASSGIPNRNVRQTVQSACIGREYPQRLRPVIAVDYAAALCARL
jgi:hypothetical protein